MANMKVKCDWCRKELKISPYRYKNSKNHFCSQKCHGKWKSINNKGKNNPNWKEKIKKKCDFCFKDLKVIPYRHKNFRYFFCNKKCYYNWCKKIKRNPWNKGLTKEDHHSLKIVSEKILGKKNPNYNKEPWNKGLTKEKHPSLKSMSEKKKGENHPNWNPNREQVYQPYTEMFYDQEFRNNIWKFQHDRDLLTGDKLEECAHLHHFNKDKRDDSHFIKGDDYCNVGFLNTRNHGKCDSQKKYKKYCEILKKNCANLRNVKITEMERTKYKSL